MGGSEGIYQSNLFFFHTNLSWDFNTSEIGSFPPPPGGPLEDHILPSRSPPEQANGPRDSRFLDKFHFFCWKTFSGGLDDPPPP